MHFPLWLWVFKCICEIQLLGNMEKLLQIGNSMAAIHTSASLYVAGL